MSRPKHKPTDKIDAIPDEIIEIAVGRWGTVQELAQAIQASIYNDFRVGDITATECADVLRYFHAMRINNVN